MKNDDNNIVIHRFSLARALLLAALLVFHAGLVFRFRVVRIFPVEWVGYAFLGVLFSLVAAGLIWLSLSRSTIRSNTLPLPDFISSMVFRRALGLSVVLAVLSGIFWRYQVYAGTPIHSSMGDMLPLINMTCSTFLSGEFPYKVYELPWKVPLTYMPGMWMAYIPSRLFEFDPRHIGLLLSGFTMLLLLCKNIQKEAGSEKLLASWFVIIAFCLSPAIVRFSINGHTYPLWFYIAAFGFCTLRGYHRTAAFCFGLMLATRQTSIIYLPFVMIFYWRQGGWRTLLMSLILIGIVCAGLCLPFAVIDLKAFLLDPMEAYKQMAYWDFQLGEQSFASKTIGFAYAFKTLGWMSDLSWLRYALLAVLPVIAWWCVKDTFSFLVSMGAAGILFAVLAPVSWYYIYIPPILILSFAVLSPDESKPVSVRLGS